MAGGLGERCTSYSWRGVNVGGFRSADGTKKGDQSVALLYCYLSPEIPRHLWRWYVDVALHCVEIVSERARNATPRARHGRNRLRGRGLYFKIFDSGNLNPNKFTRAANF